jgi:hypothetical protein
MESEEREKNGTEIRERGREGGEREGREIHKEK